MSWDKRKIHFAYMLTPNIYTHLHESVKPFNCANQKKDLQCVCVCVCVFFRLLRNQINIHLHFVLRFQFCIAFVSHHFFRFSNDAYAYEPLLMLMNSIDFTYKSSQVRFDSKSNLFKWFAATENQLDSIKLNVRAAQWK